MMYILNLILISLYSFAYYKLTEPPENWVVNAILTVTWICNTTAISGSIAGICICRSSMPELLYRELRVALMCNYVLSYIMLSVICNVFLYIHNHLYTAGFSSVAIILMISAILVFIFTDIKTTRCPEENMRFINNVLQSWEEGDFVKVAAYLSQCSSSEIADITLQVSKKYGSEEASLIQELTR